MTGAPAFCFVRIMLQINECMIVARLCEVQIIDIVELKG